MLGKLLSNELPVQNVPVHEEGELYKIVDVHGVEFSLYYGFYEDCDRDNPLVDPMPIYPDLKANPRYTDDGRMIVTRMQDSCENYKGDTKRSSDTTCAECKYFCRSEEWFGICTFSKNRRSDDNN